MLTLCERRRRNNGKVRTIFQGLVNKEETIDVEDKIWKHIYGPHTIRKMTWDIITSIWKLLYF